MLCFFPGFSPWFVQRHHAGAFQVREPGWSGGHGRSHPGRCAERWRQGPVWASSLGESTGISRWKSVTFGFVAPLSEVLSWPFRFGKLFTDWKSRGLFPRSPTVLTPATWVAGWYESLPLHIRAGHFVAWRDASVFGYRTLEAVSLARKVSDDMEDHGGSKGLARLLRRFAVCMKHRYCWLWILGTRLMTWPMSSTWRNEDQEASRRLWVLYWISLNSSKSKVI